MLTIDVISILFHVVIILIFLPILLDQKKEIAFM